MNISFRRILENDVDDLQNIALKTFEDSYKHLNTASNFQWYVQRAFNKSQLLSEIKNGESWLYFVLQQDIIIGYLKFNVGKAQTEVHSKEYLEVERIYLNHTYQGMGIGKQMIHFANRIAKEMTKDKIWLGVWDKNPKAIKFYQGMGFEESGSHIFVFGDENQTDIIMEREVTFK
ncbi:MAG: N-acetyltransferase [Saprospiraceae bacterium]|nr:N-acetyltransferase [Saprospiraceae bacterium]